MAVIDLSALKTEMSTDPLGVGYAFDGSDDGSDADLINTHVRTVNRSRVDTAALRGATTFDAHDGLTTAERQWFEWLTQNGEIPVNADTLANLAGIGGTSKWAAGDRGTMEPRIAALMQRDGSRAEELFGSGARVTASDVANARAL